MGDEALALRDGPVLVIGSAAIDIVGHLKAELHLGTSTPASIRTTFGGVGRNVAENLARLGQKVTLVTAVGNDPRGDSLLAKTAEAGVNVELAIRSPQHPTSSYLAAIDGAGELKYAMDDMRAISALTPEIIRERASLFGNSAVLFIDANLSKDTLRTVMTLARKSRLMVCADPTSPLLASRLRPFLSRLYLMTPNFNEGAAYCSQTVKTESPRQGLVVAKNLVAQGVKIAIITLGELGLCYASSETSGHIPAIRTHVLDPTGAGDALSAAVIFALMNDIPLDDAVRLGVSAASLTLQYRGAVVPDLSLEKLYDQLVI